MLFVNALVKTMDGPDISNGYVRARGRVIDAVGGMEKAPEPAAGEERRDLAGRIIMPGFIDAHSHMGLSEDGLGDEGDDINETSDPCTPHLRAIDGINPADRSFAEAAASGVTTVVVSPGSANPVGGQICAVKTVGNWIDAMAVAQPLAIKLAFGENPKTVYGEKNQFPVTRMATAAIIRENLRKAERYMEAQERAQRDDEADPPEYDAKLEALIPLLKREIKAHIHAHRAYDILTGLRLCGEFNLDYTIVHGTEGYMIADILGKAGAGIICGPIICARVKPELSNMNLKNCAELARAGVRVAISTDHPVVPGEFLLLSARIAHANGMEADAALRAVTSTAAAVLGLEKRVGSIKPGLDADLLVFSADPLSGFVKPDEVYIAGEERRLL